MNKVKFFRLEQGLPLEGLAQLTGISKWIIRAIELGHRDASPLEKSQLSRYLGQPVSRVFEGE